MRILTHRTPRKIIERRTHRETTMVSYASRGSRDIDNRDRASDHIQKWETREQIRGDGGSCAIPVGLLTGKRYSGGLPFTIDGTIVSTADATPPSSNNNAAEWELYMDTVEIKGSNVPILCNLLNSENVALRSWDLSKVL